MPTLRFRIARSIPRRLEYSRAEYLLEVVQHRHGTIPVAEWSLQARKVGVGTVCVIASALAFRSRLEDALDRGFEVEADTPAARIMRRLVRDGIAVEQRNGRR